MISVVYVYGWGQRVTGDVPQEIFNQSSFVHGSERSIDRSLCVGGKVLKHSFQREDDNNRVIPDNPLYN